MGKHSQFTFQESDNAPLEGDGTAGRVLRKVQLQIEDGTNANTLSCELDNRWNGDDIAATDNIAKNATTGNFTLSADGKSLTVEAAGLSGNVLTAIGFCRSNASAVSLDWDVRASGNDIIISGRQNGTAAAQDLTSLVDTGAMYLEIRYMTDA